MANSAVYITNLEKKTDEFFTVLDTLEVVLPSEISWSANDIENELHRGAIFRASACVDEENSSDGYVLFCDVSQDGEEPEIAQLTTEGLQDVESSLREALGKQFNILSAGETKLLKNDADQNVLISTYSLMTTVQNWRLSRLERLSRERSGLAFAHAVQKQQSESHCYR